VTSVENYIEWLSTGPGALKPAPTTLGNHQYKAQAEAPGSFVHAV
jgi:poly(3-hydroxyalkanoate) synthetase